MTKVRAVELLEKVEEQLKEARANVRNYKDQVEILDSARAYLEFIISGMKKNPSLKKKDQKEEDE